MRNRKTNIQNFWRGHNIFVSTHLQVGGTVAGIWQTVFAGSRSASLKTNAVLVGVVDCKVSGNFVANL